MRRVMGARHAIAVRLGLGPKAHVLITGAPRTGTSALLHWLRRQPGVVAFFESRILVTANAAFEQIERFQTTDAGRPDHIVTLRRAVHAMYGREQFLSGSTLVDKEPLEPIAFPERDYRGFLRRYFDLFPRGRIVYMARNPQSAIWSMRNRRWGTSLTSGQTHDLSLEACVEIWRETARIAADIRDDPRVHLVRFERLVQQPEAEGAAIARHVGVRMERSFVPLDTKTLALSAAEADFIDRETAPERSLLGY